MDQPASKCLPVSKTYKREFLTSMIIYAVLLIVTAFIMKHGPSSIWWRIPLSLVPMIPIFFALRAFMRFFQRIDELQRRIQLEAFTFSFGVTCVVTFSYGLLEYAGLPALDWIWVPPFMLILHSIGVYIASRRYQ